MYSLDIPSPFIVDFGSQVRLLILRYLELVAETLNLDLKILGSRNLLTSVGREIVLVMRLGTVLHTETSQEILNWLAGHAAADFGAVTRLAI